MERLEPRLCLSLDAAVAVAPHELPVELFGVEFCELSALPFAEADEIAPEETEGAAASAPLSETFLLHSNPGANHTIYLDFDGHTTTGTVWNSSFTGGAAIVTPAYDFDGNVSQFSDAELERIQRIWQRVVEDFLPFNVDVTTEDPGTAALRKTGGGDTQWGVRVVIGGSSYDWYGAGAGGVAYVGSFNWSSDTPTFVFEAQLGNGNEKYTAEAISHEAGHTVGLSHDGRTSPSESYYQGHGSGATGWAPVLGVGYYKELTQWSKGEYANANNTQDDLAIITSNNGFGYRPDDYGNDDANASILTPQGSSVSVQGIIERNTDFDVFALTVGAGTIDLDIIPFERGPNLDILVQLYDAPHILVASDNPSDALNASISVFVTAGQYYLYVSGTGKGDPLVTGYTDYGSLGYYSISGTIPPAPIESPPTVLGVYVRGSGAQSWDASFLAYLEDQALGDATLGWAIPHGGGQLDVLPWINANTLSIRFSGDVVVVRDDLVLVGSSSEGASAVPEVAGSTFSYDSGSFTATWEFASALPANKYLVHLPDSIVSSAGGLALDGEWIDGVTTGNSGDDTAGGDFNFRFNVVPGDQNRSQGVTFADAGQIFLNDGASPGGGNYSVLQDMNGSGGITFGDAGQAFLRVGTSISTLVDPVAPTASAPAQASGPFPSDDPMAGESLPSEAPVPSDGNVAGFGWFVDVVAGDVAELARPLGTGQRGFASQEISNLDLVQMLSFRAHETTFSRVRLAAVDHAYADLFNRDVLSPDAVQLANAGSFELASWFRFPSVQDALKMIG